MYKILIRPVLFLFGAETAHNVTFKLAKTVYSIPGVCFLSRLMFDVKHSKLETTVFGLKFKSPVGVAAGFDKNAQLIDQLDAMGFGFVEIGTVTPKFQAGNDKPRLFRLKEDAAIINRMGFNNGGVEAVIKNLKKRKSNLLIGGNIGKNKITPNENALSDYEYCFNALYDFVDYFVVNVSSPNTPNLRELQEKEPLQKLLGTLQAINLSKPKAKPILLKIAPDLTNEQLDDIIDIVCVTQIAGVIATNTTVNRENLLTDWKVVTNVGAGGLSGAPLRERSTEVIKYLVEKSNKAFPVIGVGGIMNEKDALEKLKAGASLVQLYTGFVYEGPGLVKRINKAILRERR